MNGVETFEQQPVRSFSAFIGHGTPQYAVSENPFTPTWVRYFEGVPNPEAIVMASAHWYGPGTAVTAEQSPRTIHDFGGFGPELFAIQYPALGNPALAARVVDLLAPHPVAKSLDWGLDHGTWTVMMHIWPSADVPVVQLRIDSTLRPGELFEIGRRLEPLRDDGVAIIGSGNIVHNLASARPDPSGHPAEWNVRFDTDIADWLERRDFDALVGYEQHADARMAVPTPDHFLPLLVVAGASGEADQLETITEGYDLWSLSMRSLVFV